MEGHGDEEARGRDCHGLSSSNENMEGGNHNHSASFDVTLNIVDVVSSIDDQSRADLDSLGGSSSFPELIPGSPDNYHHHQYQPQQLDPPYTKEQTYPYFGPRDEESQEFTTGSRQRSSTTTSGTPPFPVSSHTEPAPPASVVSPRSRAAVIIRHFRLVILSEIFFVIGSALFLVACLEEYQALSNSQESSPTSAVEATSEPVNGTILESLSPTAAPVPEGYHLQLSTSIDTHITQQMMLMICATFCFLQVGIINFVRTPLDKFHFFQILAGIFGLVSAMFWETKDILSTIAYFFFVHAMMGQSVLQFHSHYWTMLAPSWTARRHRRQNKQETLSSKPLPLEQRQGHFSHPSSPHPMDDHVHDDISFSIGNSFSLEEPPYPPSSDADLSYTGDMTDDGNMRARSGPAEQIMIQQGIEMTARKEAHDERDDDDATFQYGIVFCVADGFFIFGSTVELVLTYWDTLLLSNSNDDDDNFSNAGPEPSLHLLPGIFWFVFAVVTLVATILLQRYRFEMPASGP